MSVVIYAALGVLAWLLITAVWYDITFRRIPNWLVFSGALLGIMANGLLPFGFGFAGSVLPGGLGWLAALEGLGLGLALLLPFYWLRAMAAGDVKLMAMVGAFLGPTDVLGAVLCTFLAGGVMAILIALRAHMLGRLVQNLRAILLGGLVKVSAGLLPTMDVLPQSVGKLPYAVAIATGSFGYIVWRHLN